MQKYLFNYGVKCIMIIATINLNEKYHWQESRGFLYVNKLQLDSEGGNHIPQVK